MGIPETVLSNPIVSLGVESFAQVYNGSHNHTRGKYQIGKSQAESLARFKVHPTSVVAAQSQWNPILWSVEDLSPCESMDLALSTVKLVSSALSNGLKGRVDQPLEMGINSSFPNLTNWSETTLKWFRRAETWRKIVKHQVQMDAKGSNTWETTKVCFVNRHFIVIPLKSVGNVVLSNDMVLMIKDITHSYLSASVHLDLVGSQCHLLHSDLEFLEHWSTQVLRHMDNSGYEVIKSIESVCKGRIIQLTETVLDPDEVYNEMISKPRAKEMDKLGTTSLTRMLSDHLQGITDVDRVSEFFCLVKMAGHPQVDVIGGGRKAKTKGKNHPFLRGDDCKGIERSFCHLYTRGYIDKHKEWPPLQFLRREGEDKSELEKLRDDDFKNLPLGLSIYPSSDWDRCVFLPHKSFDFGSDILSMISDKSLSFLRSEFAHAWNKYLDFPTPRPTTQRRVLLDLLKMLHFSLEDIVRIVQRREVPDEWKIVTITPKEREMKVDPRMFAMMVFHMRTFFVALEHNTANHIFPEISEQTMTLSKLETVRRFFGLSNPGELTTKVHIEVDFESWNLAWEEKSVAPIGSRYDQIFGEPGTYTYIHQFFKESLINVRVDGFVPEGLNSTNIENPPESDLIWYGHLGGFEGINQKLWTGSTFGMIHWALWSLGIDYQISGQADNQVITLTVRYPEGIEEQDKTQFVRDLVAKVKATLKANCAKVGQIIKEEECIQSTSYLSYSKDMWVNGRSLSTSMKALTRLFPTTSDDCPSLTEMISGLTSGGLSVAEKSLDPGSAYWVTLALVALLIHNELTSSVLHKRHLGNQLSYGELTLSGRISVCTVLSVIPLPLGGLPTPSWLEFMHRGVPDPLTSALTWCHLISSLRIVKRWLGHLLDPSSPWIELDPNLDMLILDPFSIPLNKPANPKLKAANAVRDNLLDVTRNHDIRAMLHSGDVGAREDILKWLSEMKPFYPKVAHELYSCSPSGVVEKFSKRFTTTRTLLSLGTMCGVDVQGISTRSDLRTISWTLSSLRTSILNLPPDRYQAKWKPNLSYIQAKTLRMRWTGSDQLGVTTAHAFDLGRYSSAPVTEPISQGVVIARISELCIDPIHSRGHSSPYLGSSTQVKTAYKSAKPVDSSPPVKDALKILSLRNWIAQPGSRMWDDMSRLAQTRVSFPTSDLDQFIDPVIGGTLIHRLTMSDAESGAYLSCHPNLASNIVLSSNLSGPIGEKDYPVMMQAVYLTLIALLGLTWVNPNGTPKGLCRGVRLCYLLPDVTELDEIFDVPMGDPISRMPNVGLPGGSSFLTGSSVYVPGRSRRSAECLSVSPDRIIREHKDGSLVDCLRHHLRQWTKRIPTPIRMGGRSWAEELPLKVIDIPEVYHILDVDFLRGVMAAIMDRIRLGRLYRESQEDWENRYKETSLDALLKVAPGLLSTFNSTQRTQVSKHLGRLYGIEGSIRFSCLCIKYWKDLGLDHKVVVFIREPESLSTSIMILFNRLITRLNLVGTRQSLSSAKALGEITRKINMLAVDSWDLQRRLWIAVERVEFLQESLVKTNVFPAQVIRNLRKEVIPDAVEIDILAYLNLREEEIKDLIMTSCGECKPSGLELNLGTTTVNLEREEVISGWVNRPLSYLGSGLYNWLPVRVLTNPQTTYHIIGAGDATIDAVLHQQSTRIYYDTLESTLRRGQSMVDPPSRGKSHYSSLCPLSWSGNIDIRDSHSISQIVNYISDISTVIIDVDLVSVHDRVRARDIISSKRPGVLVLVRLTGEESEIKTIEEAICSSSSNSTVWWRSPIHPANEIMVGNSSGTRICPVIPLTNQGRCKSYSDSILRIVTPEQWREEREYTSLSSKLIIDRLKLARRSANREEERIIIVNRVLEGFE
jgi:hypothetical protein